MRESKTLEFKRDITNSFLKTVSAFSNYSTGSILFGVNDDGVVMGIENPSQACLDIENRINDSISPNPDYTLSIDSRNVVTLTVKEGPHKPYLYKAKAYKRNDTSTVEVDRVELLRLVLEGSNLSFDATPARSDDFSFSFLEKSLREVMDIKALTEDMLKTLGLQSRDGSYTVAGELLADVNTFPGIDAARFGETINVFLDRESWTGVSVLQQYEEALSFFRKYYVYEKIEGARRVTVETVPESAFREAIANALVHRTWDVDANVRVSMHPDRIEVASPGGLPRGLNREEYLEGRISTLRNPVLGGVFFRLGLIERFGTGVPRIKEAYRDSASKPLFTLRENSITVVLPLLDADSDLADDERIIVRLLKGRSLSMGDVVAESGFGRTKALGLLKGLAEHGRVQITGKGRGTRYGA